MTPSLLLLTPVVMFLENTDQKQGSASVRMGVFIYHSVVFEGFSCLSSSHRIRAHSRKQPVSAITTPRQNAFIVLAVSIQVPEVLKLNVKPEKTLTACKKRFFLPL